MSRTKIFLLYNSEDITAYNHKDIIPFKLNQTEYFESEAFRMLNEEDLPDVENIGFITPSSKFKIPNFSIEKILQLQANPITFLWPQQEKCEEHAVKWHGDEFLIIWKYLLDCHSISYDIINTYNISFSNLWIAKKTFVIEYLKFAKKTINFLDNSKDEIKNILFSDSKYIGKLTSTGILKKKFGYNHYPFHPFVMERIICLFSRIKTVNSFDVFDTIIARRCNVPTDIFLIIEKTYPFPNFEKFRKKSEINALTLNDIYLNFQNITKLSNDEIENLKDFEIQTEINNSYLIITNYNLVKDGDILISDMYLSSEQIMRILVALGFKKKVTIYSSSCGKSKYNGSMYEYLNTLYKINLHIGDNEYSDIVMAKKYNIPTKITTIHKLNNTELFFFENGYCEFAFILREFRHTNCYLENTKEFNLFDDQISVNIPILVYISQKLNDFMIKNNKETLLLFTRDGCFLEHIFPTLYKTSNYKRFESSRRIHSNYNEEYKKYVKSMYNDKCVIFDLNGSFSSGRKLYLEIFNKLPTVYVFSYDYADVSFDGFHYMINYNQNKTGHFIEKYNTDTVGTLLNLKDGKFIRRELEYDIKDVLIYKNTIKSFCNFITNKYIENILDIDIVSLCNRILRKSNIISITPPNFVKDKHFEKFDTIIYTFSILIATIGRPGLQNMLNSLSPQLSERDCLTVVFDGKTEIPTTFDFSKFKCKINLFNEPVALKFWGHGIRNKYASILERRDFIMHADDDNIYTSDAFNIIRSCVSNTDTLYVFKMLFEDRLFPVKHLIKEGNIDTSMGVIPYELNKKGEWLYRYGGDGAFYEKIAKFAKNITYYDKCIYIIRPNQTYNTDIKVIPNLETQNIKTLINTKNIKFIPENSIPIPITQLQPEVESNNIVNNTGKTEFVPEDISYDPVKQFSLGDFVNSFGVKPFSNVKFTSEIDNPITKPIVKSIIKTETVVLKNNTFNPEEDLEKKNQKNNIGVVPKIKPIKNTQFDFDLIEETYVEPIKIRYTQSSSLKTIDFNPQEVKQKYFETSSIDSFLKLLNDDVNNRNTIKPQKKDIVKPDQTSIFEKFHPEPMVNKTFNPGPIEPNISHHIKLDFKVDNSLIHNTPFVPKEIERVEIEPENDSDVMVLNTNKIEFIPKPVIPIIQKTIPEADARRTVLNTKKTEFIPKEIVKIHVKTEELSTVPRINTSSVEFVPTFNNTEKIPENTDNHNIKLNTTNTQFLVIPQEEKEEEEEDPVFNTPSQITFVPTQIDKAKLLIDNSRIALILHGNSNDINLDIHDFIKLLSSKFKIHVFIHLWDENSQTTIDNVKEQFKNLLITKVIVEDPKIYKSSGLKNRLKKFWDGQIKIINSVNEAQYKSILSLRMDYFNLASRFIKPKEYIFYIIEKSLQTKKIFLNSEVLSKGLDNIYCGNIQSIKTLVESINTYLSSTETTNYEKFLMSKVDELNFPYLEIQPPKKKNQPSPIAVILPHAILSKKIK